MLRLTERIEIPRSTAGFLPWFAPRSPAGLFDAWGPIPGVAEVLDQTGVWTAPGSSRTLRLSDGSRITEEVLAYASEGPFRYRMSGFSGLLPSLADQIEGEWATQDLGGNRGLIHWTYRFHDRGALPRLALRAMSPAWRGYMRAGLRKVERAFAAEPISAEP